MAEHICGEKNRQPITPLEKNDGIEHKLVVYLLCVVQQAKVFRLSSVFLDGPQTVRVLLVGQDREFSGRMRRQGQVAELITFIQRHTSYGRSIW